MRLFSRASAALMISRKMARIAFSVVSYVIMRTGCFLGVDVGAISWIIAGIKMNGKLRVVHAEQVLCRGGDDVLFIRVCELMDNIGPAFGVIDAGPDFNTADKLTRKYPTKFLACEYADKLSSPMVTLDVKEERRVVRAHRDKRFDLLVRDCNSGAIEWAPVKDASIISEHLKGMKKMRQLDEDSAASSIEDASESAMHWVCASPHRAWSNIACAARRNWYCAMWSRNARATPPHCCVPSACLSRCRGARSAHAATT